MNQDLEQLKQIVNSDEGFTKEDRDEVAKIEEMLVEAVAAENLAQHPALKAYLDSRTKEILDCKELLSSELERLDEKARDRLFERIRQCKDTLRHFGQKKEDIEYAIKNMLENAKR